MEDNISYQQEIEQYSLEELYDVAEHIDREKASERFRMVLAEIKKRQGKVPPQTQGSTLEQQATSPMPRSDNDNVHFEERSLDSDGFENLLHFRRRIRPIIVVAACLIAGVVLLVRYFSPLPSQEQLSVVEGTIFSVNTAIRNARYTKDAEYVTIQLAGDRGVYNYLDWFPDMAELKTQLARGDSVRLWVDKGKNDWIWQIEKEHSIIRTYDDIRGAIRHNNRYDGLIGGALLIAGIFGGIRLTFLMLRKDNEINE